MSDTRVAAITGGGRGLGRAIALDLAHRGWSIAFCYRTSEDAAERTAREVRDAGSEAWPDRCDVSDPDAAERWITGCHRRHARLDAVVNAAGPFQRVGLLDQRPSEWRAIFENNLDPVFFTARAAAPLMIAQGWGRILNFSMANADRVVANTGVTAHFIAKTAVQQLSRALARELAPHGITVNCISPGIIATESADVAELERMQSRIPAGRLGTPADVVAAARFLLSDEAAYITGANLIVSGGWGI